MDSRSLLDWTAPVRSRVAAAAEGGKVFFSDVGHGLLEVCHNSLAMLGLGLVAVVFFASSRPEVRAGLESRALGWLQARHEARVEGTAEALSGTTDPQAILRATAIDPKDLGKEQAAVAQWLSRRYRVAPEPVSRLVKEAWAVGDKVNLDPTLILAIMAIESSFNPFAQSPVGAQGLMQVMTRVHDDKYEPFGGNHAAFDPVTNLRVGVLVLKECIARAGSIEAGLRFYVGAGNSADDGGYAWKVMAEQQHLRNVAAGRLVSVTAPLGSPPAVLVKQTDAPEDTAAPSAEVEAKAAAEAAAKTDAEKVALLN